MNLLFGEYGFSPPTDGYKCSCRGAHASVVAVRDARSGQFSYAFRRGARESKCGANAGRDAAVRRFFSIRVVEPFSEGYVERLNDLPEDRWIEVEVHGEGNVIEPFRMSLLEPRDESPPARIDAFLRQFGDGFAVEANLLGLWRLDCRKSQGKP